MNQHMDRRKFWRNLTRVHKWAGLVLMIQIILWFATGLFMSFFDIDKVHGDNMAEGRTWSLQMEKAAPFSEAHALYVEHQKDIHCSPMQRNACIISPLKHINLLSAIGTPVWEFDNGETKTHYSGSPATPWAGLSEDKIRGAARSYYKGDTEISKVVLFTEIVPKISEKTSPSGRSHSTTNRTRVFISPPWTVNLSMSAPACGALSISCGCYTLWTIKSAIT